jgi:hypothetical protein
MELLSALYFCILPWNRPVLRKYPIYSQLFAKIGSNFAL